MLDQAVAAAYRAWSSVLVFLATLAPTRLALDEWRNEQADASEDDTWRIAHHDNWAAAVLAGLHRLVAHVRAGHTNWTDFDRSVTPQDLINLVNAVPVRQDAMAERQVVARILSLPVWQKRYDLCSNWILTRMVDALKWTGPQIMVTDELRSPLKGPSKNDKRKEGVQPGYSVLLGDDADPAASSIFEVECKQYRQARADNFGAALHDYALARPEADALLVNYGPISPRMQQSILNHVAEELRSAAT